MSARALRRQSHPEISSTGAVNPSNSAGVIPNRDFRTILGINFFAGRAMEAVALGLNGGLVVAPSAPGLANMPDDEPYRVAVSNADVAITDSSLMVMLWNLTRRDNIPRVSGLEYLTLLLQAFRRTNHEFPFFVMPSKEAAVRTLKWLKGQGIQCADSHCYIAPQYGNGEVGDFALLAVLEELQPAHIIICVGSGPQEKLGLFLRRRLSYTPGIHCIGAAIAFLTGDQVRIPIWADRLYLGWLFRCLDKPTSYIPRYWRAKKLFRQMIFDRKANRPTNEMSGGVSQVAQDTRLRQPQTVNVTTSPSSFFSEAKSPASEKPPVLRSNLRPTSPPPTRR